MQRSFFPIILIAALTLVSSSLAAEPDNPPSKPPMMPLLKAIRAETAQQNEAAVSIAATAKRVVQPFDEERNVYFGDTHVHTALSFDSYLNGNRLSLDEAYRFASGEPMTLLMTNETMPMVSLNLWRIFVKKP